MYRYVPPVQRVFHCAQRLLAMPTRLSVALGAMLLLGSSLSVMATVNTKPTITSATLSATTIDEGDTVTLDVTFSDPDVTDVHQIEIHWVYGLITERQELVLPAGQLSFQASHTYRDNRYDALPGDTRTVKVWVSDVQPGNDNNAGAGIVNTQLAVTVKNVAPTINTNHLTVTKAGKSNAVVVEGQFAEPGADPVHVTASWGDGNTGPGFPKAAPLCEVNQHAKTFRCEHTYESGPAKTYQIGLRARDDDGGQDTATISVQIP